MNEKIISFKKFQETKKKKDEGREIIKRTEQKEENIISVKLVFEDIPSIHLLSIKNFLGEKYIYHDLIEEGDGFRLDLPRIPTADLEELLGIIKDKNVSFKIEESK